MGCTGGTLATPCEFPAIGYNCRGIGESIDRTTGNFCLKSHPNSSWVGTGDDRSPCSRVFYTFPVLADSIAGISVSFKAFVKGNPSQDQVSVKLELIKSDQKTVLTAPLTKVTGSPNQYDINVNPAVSALQQAKKGDLFRLKCSNLFPKAIIHISRLSATITSRDGYSCVRLPFEEFLLSSSSSNKSHNNSEQILSLRSYKIWELRSLKAPIGWTDTPLLGARPSSIDGVIEFDILSTEPAAPPVESPGKQRRGSKENTNNTRSPSKTTTADSSPQRKGSPTKANPNPAASSTASPQTRSVSKRLSFIENSIRLNEATGESLGDIRFSMSLIRGQKVVLTYVIIDQNRLHPGHNRIAFRINDKLSTPLLTQFKVGDRYQIDRYHARSDLVLRVTKFHFKIMTKERRTLVPSPHRLMTLPPTESSQQLVTFSEDIVGLDVANVESTEEENEKKRNHNPEYDSFYYITPDPSGDDQWNEEGDEDPHELHMEIHRGQSRSGPHRPRSGWGSWVEYADDEQQQQRSGDYY